MDEFNNVQSRSIQLRYCVRVLGRFYRKREKSETTVPMRGFLYACGPHRAHGAKPILLVP